MSLVEREDRPGVRILFLNRPERRNALSGELIEALHAELAAAGADGGVRCVVLAGRGASFCAGGDLAGGMMPDGGIVEAERGRARYAALLEALQSLPVPVIAAVHGDALGGGLGLVAACDLAVADEGARLGTPEIKVGLFPYIITAVLQRIVSRRALLELMFTGDRIDAARAESLGLVNRVAPAGRSLEVALELADKVAGQSRAILALGKRSFYEAADLPLHSALELLTGRLTVNMLTEDAMEGVAAFLGRRPPEWKHR